ncbi:transposase [Streptomyces umbrinus]|uniref:transposase n=1 Tax=Streptomyces umbrinus TaxID=67370 RepID=UPI0027D7E6A1|nr:transposase [Streptomyces umbrinus]
MRERAVRMYRTTEPKPVLKRMAAELGVRPEALRGWIRQAGTDAGEREDRLTTDGLLLGFAPQLVLSFVGG